MQTLPRPRPLGSTALVALLSAVLALAVMGVARLDPPVFDANGDGTADTIVAEPATDDPTLPGTVGVLSGATGAVLYTLSGISPGDNFGFVAIPVGDLTADGIADLVVGAPRAGLGGAAEGRVSVFSGHTGQAVYTITGPEGTRIGLAVAQVADQDRDHVPDLLVAGATLTEAGNWRRSTFLFSGRSGRFLVAREPEISSLLSYVADGGILYLAEDLDDSGAVDQLDLIEILPLVGTAPGAYGHGDLTGDGVVDAADMRRLIDALLAGEHTIVASGFVPKSSESASGFESRWSQLFPSSPLAASGGGDSGPTGGEQAGGQYGSQEVGGISPCTCNSGGSPGTGSPPQCSAQIFGCPGIARVGDEISIFGFGAGLQPGCSWYVTDGAGNILVLDQSPGRFRFRAVAPGSVTIRLECGVGDCCACSQCTIPITDETAPCTVAVHITNCPTGNLSPAHGLLLHAEGYPAGGEYRWSVADPDQIVSSFQSRANESFTRFHPVVGSGARSLAIVVQYGSFPSCYAVAHCTVNLEGDTDGDGLTDAEEALLGTNPNSADTDHDGYSDFCEVRFGGDPLNAAVIPPGSLLDSDRDGLSDLEERCTYRTDPFRFDTDGDGVQDLAEVELGLNPLYRFTHGGLDRYDVIYTAHDRDGDGLYDEYEAELGLDPTNPDTDGDGIPDGDEVAMGTDPTINPHGESPDSDGDGLRDSQETLIYHTDPHNFDTDGDGLPDGLEVRLGLNPLSADSNGNGVPDGQEDNDGDGLDNFSELQYGTNPGSPDSDGDGVLDGAEVIQGSFPNDPTDGGLPPAPGEYADFFFYALQLSTQHIECEEGIGYDQNGWGITIGSYNLRMRTCFDLATLNGSWDPPPLRLRRGAVYPINWQHLSTCVFPCGPRYDPQLGGGYFYLDSGRAPYIIADPYEPKFLLTYLCDEPPTEYDYFSGKTAFIGLPTRPVFVPDPATQPDPSRLVVPRCGTARATITVAGVPDGFYSLTIYSPYGEVASFIDGSALSSSIPLRSGSHTFEIVGLQAGYAVIDINTNPGVCGIASEGVDGMGGLFDVHLPILVTLAGDPPNAPIVDLDIDSDNDNDLSLPTRSAAEENIEDVADSPGKIVPVNDDDSDSDGVPDFADGYNLNGTQDRDDVSLGNRFVPVVLQVSNISDPAHQLIVFGYDASDPRGVTLDGNHPEAPYTPAPGSLRLWKRDGIETRDRRRVAVGGDYVAPNSPVTCAQLGLSPTGGTVTLWLETVRPSVSLGDHRVSVVIAGFPCSSDSVTSTSFGTRFVQVDPRDGSLQTARLVPMSQPTPTIAMAVPDITNLRTSADYTRLLVDLHLEGVVDDAASDLIPGQAGTVRELAFSLNGARVFPNGPDQPPLVIPVGDISKVYNPESILEPFDFTGRFTATITELEVQPGWNLIQVYAANVYGFTGYAEVAFEVEANPPPDDQTDVHIEISDPDPYGNPTQPISVGFRHNGGDWSTHQLTWSGNKPGEYVLGDLMVRLPNTPFDPTHPDLWEVRVWNPDLDLQDEHVWLQEDGDNTRRLDGLRLVQEQDRTTWRDYQLLLSVMDTVSASNGGTFQPFLIEPTGPQALLQSVIDTTIADQHYQLNEYAQRQFLGTPGDSMPRLYFALPRNALDSQTLAEYFRQRFGISEDLQIFYGYGAGYADAGVALWDGVVSLAEAGWHAVEYYNPVSINHRVTTTGGVLTVADARSVSVAMETAQMFAEVSFAIGQGEAELIYAVQTHDEERLNRLAEECELGFDFATALWEQVWESFDELPPFEKGRIVGRITGEIELAVVTAEAGEALKSGTILRVVEKLRDVPYINQYPAVIGAVESGVEFAGDLATSRMCFVAGTPVLTAAGPRAIETIKPDELVMSRDPTTGQQEYRPVRATIVTHPDHLVQVYYFTAAGKPESLTGTAEHPFYVVGRREFVPAGELTAGDVLLLACGGTAHVTDVQIERGPPRGVFTTYNLDVADFHTYFVGGAGVWVHNEGTICERLKAIFIRLKDKEGIEGLAALERFMEITDLPERRAFADGHLRDVAHETMTDIYARLAVRADGTIDLTRVPKMRELRQLGYARRFAKANLEDHHTMPEYLLKQIIANNHPDWSFAQIEAAERALEPDIPGYLVHKINHTGDPGDGVGSFHSILSRSEDQGGVGLWGGNQYTHPRYNTPEILRGLDRAYERWGRPEVWQVARQWLVEKQLIPPP
jgi:hypothetical protein